MTPDRTTAPHVLLDVPITFDTEDGTTVHSPMIQATVGGIATRLILDTGSTDHVLAKELIDRVGVAAEPAEAGTDHAGAAVPSWSVGELEVGIDGAPFALRDVATLALMKPMIGWGIRVPTAFQLAHHAMVCPRNAIRSFTARHRATPSPTVPEARILR